MDIGAACNLIKSSAFKKRVGGRKTLGTCQVQVQSDAEWYNCSFNSVEDQGSLFHDGILGRDFLRNRAIIYGVAEILVVLGRACRQVDIHHVRERKCTQRTEGVGADNEGEIFESLFEED